MAEKMNIYKKLQAIQAATRSIAANAEGQTGAAKYNYVSGAKLLSVIRPLMDKLGLLLTQEVLDIKNEPITYMTRTGEKTEMFTTVHIRFTWVDTEDGSQVVNVFFANGMNAWDKGLGSALTYAERYYLMKTFHIATDEDDVDALVKEEAIKPQPSQGVQSRRAAAGKAATQPAPADKPKLSKEEMYWKVVEKEALGIKAKDGSTYREAWVKNEHPTPEQLEKFDHDVENVKLARQIPIINQ